MKLSNNYQRIILQLTAAVFVLLLGILVYVFDRDPHHIYFLNAVLSKSLSTTPVFGTIGLSLPSFVHVYVFILFTTVLLPPTYKSCLGASCFWLMTDGLFEIAQHPSVAHFAVKVVPAWFFTIPILKNTRAYFLQSTFDPLDLAAIVIGTLAAVITIIFTLKINAGQRYQRETSFANQ